jgi:hypothetical protein
VAAQHSRLGASDTARKSHALCAGLGIALDAALRVGPSLVLALSSDFSSWIIAVSPCMPDSIGRKPVPSLVAHRHKKEVISLKSLIPGWSTTIASQEDNMLPETPNVEPPRTDTRHQLAPILRHFTLARAPLRHLPERYTICGRRHLQIGARALEL